MSTAPTQSPPPHPLAYTRRDFALLALLALLIALYFWRILTPNPADRAQFPIGDFTDQFYAFRLYEARAFAEGRIPLWSENFNSGHPFLADIQSAVFYPVALVHTFASVFLFNEFSLFALELEALFHFYLAGAFTYLFARRLLSRTFPPPRPRRRIYRSPHIHLWRLSHLLPLPPTRDSRNRRLAPPRPLFHRPRLPPPAPTPPPPFLGEGGRGERSAAPQDTSPNRDTPPLPMGEGLGVRGAPHGNSSSSLASPLGIRGIIAAALILGIAALAGHPQTFLFVLATALIYYFYRAYQTDQSAPRFTLPAARFLSFVRRHSSFVLLLLIPFGLAAIQLLPAIEYQQLSTREALSFADAAKGFPTLDILQFILPGYASAFASPLYIGILPLWLAIFALLKKRSQTYFWGLLALAALLLSFGFYVFAYVLFYLFIPGASLFRQQERLAFVVSFALAILAGYGIQDLITQLDFKRARDGIAPRKLFALLPIGAVLMLALTLTFFVAGAQNPTGRLAFLGDRAGLMLILFGVTALGLGLYLRKIISLKWFIPLAIVLILFDLWSVTESANKGQPIERFPDNALIDVVKQTPGLFRVTADENIMPGHFGIAYQLQDTGGISPLRLANYDAFLTLPDPIRSRLLNVQYQFTQNAPTANQTTIFQQADQRVNQYLTPQPRAWFVNQPRIQPDTAATLQTLADPTFNPVTTAVLTAPPPFPPAPASANNTVNITSYTPESITLQLTAPADGLLIVSENDYPGWNATINGQPAPILRANQTLRAIPIPAGSQTLTLTYNPLPFKLGVIITILTLLACIIVLVFLRTSEKK